MVVATDELQARLLQLLASLPPDSNPYLAISAQVRSLVLPADDTHARNQLYVLSGVFALITILSVLSICIRWRKGILWFVRTSSTGLLRFHFSASWTVPGVIFLILLQPTMAFERDLFAGHGRSDFMYWLSLPWLALAYSGIIATWAILSSHLAQLQARGQWKRWKTYLVNSFGFILVLVYTLLLVTPAVIVGALYSKLIGELEVVTTNLSRASRDWRGGPPVLSSDALSTLQRLGQTAVGYFRNLQILFAIFAASSVLLALIMSTAAYFYLSLLRREIKSINVAFPTAHGLVLEPTSSQRKLRRIWQTIFFTVAVNIIIAILLAVNSLVIAVNPERLSDRKHLRVALLLPLFSVGAFGLLSSGMLLVRAIQAAPAPDCDRDGRLFNAAKQVVLAAGAASRQRGREEARTPRNSAPPESEEATMVGSFTDESLKRGLGKKGDSSRGSSRRSSWFERRQSAAIPLQSKILVDVEIVVDEDRRTTTSSSLSHPV